jgi:hypothetical protein
MLTQLRPPVSRVAWPVFAMASERPSHAGCASCAARSWLSRCFSSCSSTLCWVIAMIKMMLALPARCAILMPHRLRFMLEWRLPTERLTSAAQLLPINDQHNKFSEPFGSPAGAWPMSSFPASARLRLRRP